jgi:hypothetical protein
MPTRIKLLTAVLCVGVAGMATMQVLASPDAEPSAAFKPSKLTGKWSGSWKNTTFGSTGSIRATIRLKDGKLKATVQFGGNVFGCADPPPAIFELTKGKGNNQYNADGFKIRNKSEAFGTTTGSYKHSNNRIKGAGKDVACRPGLTRTATGKLTSKKFTATVKIDLGGGQKATAKLNAEKL